MAEARAVLPSPLVQGEDEAITYTLATTAWGSSPSAVVVQAYDVTDGGYVDVSGEVLSGSAAVVGDVITLPVLLGLAAGRVYRVEVRFTAGGNVFECWLELRGER